MWAYRHIGGERLPRDRTLLPGSRVIRRFYIRISLNPRRAVTPDMPPSRPGHTTDWRLGTSIGLLRVNGVESLWTLLLFSVFSGASPHQNWSALPR
jgi:hypothetical protein